MFTRNQRLIRIFSILIAITLLDSIVYVASADEPKKKQTINAKDLNEQFIVLGAFGQPIGKLFRVTGRLKEISSKPGLYLQVEAINEKPYDELIPIYVIKGTLPTREKGKRFSFSARSRLYYRVTGDPFFREGFYHTIEIEKDEKPAKGRTNP